MSIISFLGGVEASKAADLEEKFNNLEQQMLNLARMIEKAENSIGRIISDMNLKENTYDSLISVHARQIGELNNSVEDLKKHSAYPESVIRRLNEFETTQRVLTSSSTKMKNEISDLKKELYGLYNRQTPAPAEERFKSQDPNPEKKELLDLVKESDYPEFRKNRLIAALKENCLRTFDDVKSMTFEDLCDIPGLGPAAAAVIIDLRKKYTGYVDPMKKIRFDIPDWDLRQVIMDMDNIPMKQKTRIMNALYQHGVNNLKDLETTQIEEFEKIPHFGKASMKVMHNIYQNYIWA